MNTTLRAPLLATLLAGCCPFLTAPEGTEIPQYDAVAPIDDTVLARWVQTDPGMDAVARLVADPARPMELRVVSLIQATRAGQADRVAAILGALEAPDAADLAAGAVHGIATLLGDDPALTASAKGALLGAEKRWPKAGEALAQWAYAGIVLVGAADPTRESLMAAAARLTMPERMALGPLVIPAAAAFLAFDVEAAESFALLKGLAAAHPAAGTALASALQRRWQSRAATLEEVEALAALSGELVAGLLAEVAAGRHHPPDVRQAAAARALDRVAASAGGTGGAEGLVRLVALGDPSTQWRTARMAVRKGGPASLGPVIAALRSDQRKAPAPLDADAMLALCEELRNQGAGESSVDVLRTEVATGDAATRALSVVCLKLLFAQEAAPDLEGLAKLKGKPQDLRLAPFAGGETTLARLARNALEGLAMKRSLLVPSVALNLNGELVAIIDRELLATGPAYKKLVAQRTQEWKNQNP